MGHAEISIKTMLEFDVPVCTITLDKFCSLLNWVLYVVALVVAGLSKIIVEQLPKPFDAVVAFVPPNFSKYDISVAPRTSLKPRAVEFESL